MTNPAVIAAAVTLSVSRFEVGADGQCAATADYQYLTAFIALREAEAVLIERSISS